MPTIKLPQAGKAIAMGTVRRWLKSEGQVLAQGDLLAEVETDEGLLQIESPVAGPLNRILVPAGKSLAVGEPMAVIGQGDVSTVAATSAPAPAKEVKPVMSKPTGTVIPILMPKAGQSMEEGVLVKWHVKPGDTIAKGQVIFEIETDKATMEVEATDAGRLSRIVLAEGGACPVLQPVAYIAENDADVDAFLAAQGSPAAAPGNQGTKQAEEPERPSDEATKGKTEHLGGGRVKASPAARRIAEERGIDLAAVGAGSGPQGRILSTDVPAAAPKAAPAVAPITAAAPAPVTTGDGVTRKRMSQMRKAIAKNLSISKQTIPHFYIKATINADPLVSFYQGEKAKYPCSINDVVVMACARAIREFPQFRSRIEGEEIVTFDAVNIGVAVGMDEGLVVPVVVNADQLTLKQLGVETKRIAASAKAGKIEGMNKGLFTISNMGMFGVEEFSAIINPPEVAILAVGTTREEVIVSGGTLRAGKVMTLTLSVDHRVIDGSLAAKFLGRLKELLEWPAQLV